MRGCGKKTDLRILHRDSERPVRVVPLELGRDMLVQCAMEMAGFYFWDKQAG